MTGNFVDDFPHGFFFIRSKAKKMAIDVYDGGMLNEYNIIIWPQKMVDSINQLWMHEDGFLINKKSGLVLDIRGGDIKKDKVIIQYARKPGLAHNQRWKYQDGYIVSAAAPHLVLDIRGGDFKEGNQVFLNTKDSTSSTQQWLLEPFQDARSEQDLALLRPPPLEKHQSCTFPRPEELYSCYRSVFLENKPDATPEQVAAAAGFQVTSHR
ncbi:ricin B lectin domain-containing protein [Radiomyces spectabilis]|uniref:ricin B lectin domain-containing protein n=1 Tax=Radiomyces spectabilis TaxID=64574 RepID=UPI00221FEF6D|nr:ricin B lectin domain-containing protein [Radiomyces spectabilis]KAI8377745.1 ricin B lectin domain-containing protein [Radiomyces spectabilis]